jgi:Protein of unknown function (DUF3309)
MALFWFWILVALVLAAILSYPVWPYSRGWGYRASGGAFAAGVVILLLAWGGFLAVSWPWVTHL